ncbi:hypothetical protein CEXT_430181 [Caerostris extrusa]|uniref:Uncharacterized protein n=1 Tax=Caerostris extrusa TaxID=172846 RepID=A0AAV4Y0H8_CAEEX|nr:hypothetical protein CEXT_430181 [Caerostris extrusa]
MKGGHYTESDFVLARNKDYWIKWKKAYILPDEVHSASEAGMSEVELWRAGVGGRPSAGHAGQGSGVPEGVQLLPCRNPSPGRRGPAPVAAWPSLPGAGGCGTRARVAGRASWCGSSGRILGS